MAVVDDPNVDVIFLHFFAGLHENFEGLKLLKKIADEKGKVVIMWVIGLREPVRLFKRAAQEIGIPVHGELFRAVECLAAASNYQPRKSEAGASFTEKPQSVSPEAAQLLM